MSKGAYILDFPSIKMGDIIFTSNHSFSSKSIRKATKGDFSHAMICVSYGSCIHALPNGGVQSVNLQRVLFDDQSHASVLRFSPSLSIESIRNACNYARSQIGKQYSVPDAAMSLAKAGRQSNRQYCSRLVAESYAYAGIKPFGESNFCTPEDIHNCSSLFEVPNLIRLATQEEIEFAKSFDPVAEQTKITKFVFARIRRVIMKDIQTFEQLSAFVINHKGYDNAISRIISESGYLDMWRYELDKNSWKYDIKYFQSKNLNPIIIPELCEVEIDQSEEQIILYENMKAHYYQLYYLHNVNYGKIMGNLYENLVSMMKSKRETFLEVQKIHCI